MCLFLTPQNTLRLSQGFCQASFGNLPHTDLGIITGFESDTSENNTDIHISIFRQHVIRVSFDEMPEDTAILQTINLLQIKFSFDMVNYDLTEIDAKQQLQIHEVPYLHKNIKSLT